MPEGTEQGSGNTAKGRAAAAETGTGSAAGTETGTDGTGTLLRTVGGVRRIGTAAAGPAGAAGIAALSGAAAGTTMTGIMTGEENGNVIDDRVAS